MMDRNREARRAAAMANGLHRRRHRTTTHPGSFRDSPEDDGPLELHETARLRDRPVKKDRDRELRERDRDRDRERLSRSKRRRSDNKYGSVKEDGGGIGGIGGGGIDDSSEESVNDEDDDDDGDGGVRYSPPTNPTPMSTSSPASTLTSHRKSYPPPLKVYRVGPTWKAPDEMIGVSVPRKARSASTKRSHDWTSGGGVIADHIYRQPSSSPGRSSMTASATAVGTTIPAVRSPSHAPPMSPSSSNISIKKKIKAANGPKQRRPKPLLSSTKSSPSVQDEIEIEVAEVLYGLMRQSQTPSSKQEQPPSISNDSAAKLDSRSTEDSKSPITNSSSAPLVTIAPKRKRPRPCPDDIPAGFGPRSSPKVEPDQITKYEPMEQNEASGTQNGAVTHSHIEPKLVLNPSSTSADAKAESLVVEESYGGGRNGVVRGSINAEVEVEASLSSPKMDSSQNYDRVESSSTSTKPNSIPPGKEKFAIDLMAPASPEKEEEIGEYGGGTRDEKAMVTDKEAAPKSNANGVGDHQTVVKGGVELASEAAGKSEPHKSTTSLSPSQQHDLEKDKKSSAQKQRQQLPSKASRDEAHAPSDKTGGQSSSVPLPAGWHGGVAPMAYVGPLQGVVSMDGTTMASPPIQPPPPPHSLFSQPRPKRCATHWYIARSISVHQQVMKMSPFWPAAAAAGTLPLFGAKPPYNLNMVPSADMHVGRGLVGSGQVDKGQPFAFFPGHSQPPASSKDKFTQAASVPDTAQKKQFLLTPGAPTNLMHPPALFFPMGQQQPPGSSRPNSGKPPSSAGGAGLTGTSTSTSMAAAVSNAPPGGQAMSFSYPNVAGNETQFMAILGNGAYPFPIPSHVGAAPPYRGSHPQAMSFFNGSFYPSQMLHPSQLQQQQQQQHQHPGSTTQSVQIQQQNHQNAGVSTASSSSQKHSQNHQQRSQGSSANAAGNPNHNPAPQNFQGAKGQEIGGEDSPSSADIRNRPILSFYGQNYPVPFQGPNFAMMPSSLGGGSGIGASLPNGNHSEKKQPQAQQPAMNTSPFPMSFTNINGALTPGFDISSMANNHDILQSLPDSAKHNYQMMAAAAQAAQHRKNNFRCPEDGKSGAGTATDTSFDEERKAMAARASAASVGQSIAFSRDLAENSVADSSARSLNLVPGSTRSTRTSGPNTASISPNPQLQQQQSQMLFSKQQQYVPSSAASARSKTPTSNGTVYPDHAPSSSVMSAKFPNSLPGFPSFVQTSGTPTQSPQWKNAVRSNTSQINCPSLASSTTASIMKNASQQQGRTQQSQTQISFGPGNPNSKSSPVSQGQQIQNSSQAPSSPMMGGSPSSSSMSKGIGGSPRTSSGNKPVAQASTLSSHHAKNSPSPSMTNQKPSILGSPHIMSTYGSAGKSQSQQPQLQPPLSKQSIQQAQLYFSNYMQASANTSAAMTGPGYYHPMHRSDNQQQQLGPKSQGQAPATSSSGMLSLCNPVSFANATTSDPAKAVGAASNIKGGLPSQGMFNVAQFAGQSAGGAHQLMPASFPYAHSVSAGVQVKPDEQKQPAGE